MKIRIWLNIFCIFVIWINCSDWIHKLIIKYIIFRVWSRVPILLLIFTKFSFLQLGYRLQKSFDIFVPFLILIQVQSNNFWDSHGVNLLFISFNNNFTGFFEFTQHCNKWTKSSIDQNYIVLSVFRKYPTVWYVWYSKKA